MSYSNTAGLNIVNEAEYYKITATEMLTESQTKALAALVEQGVGIDRRAHRTTMPHASGGNNDSKEKYP